MLECRPLNERTAKSVQRVEDGEISIVDEPQFKVHALLTHSVSWNSLTACMVEETEHVVCPLDADNVDALDWQERTTRYDDALDNPRPGRGSKQPSLALVEVELCDEQK